MTITQVPTAWKAVLAITFIALFAVTASMFMKPNAYAQEVEKNQEQQTEQERQESQADTSRTESRTSRLGGDRLLELMILEDSFNGNNGDNMDFDQLFQFLVLDDMLNETGSNGMMESNNLTDLFLMQEMFDDDN